MSFGAVDDSHWPPAQEIVVWYEWPRGRECGSYIPKMRVRVKGELFFPFELKKIRETMTQAFNVCVECMVVFEKNFS